jgi:hypothetical protein
MRFEKPNNPIAEIDMASINMTMENSGTDCGVLL